jgi:SPP1 family predicted phage head-tail adaptor
MTAVPAGMLIHRLALQRATTGVDGLGALARNWVPVKTVWTSIAPISARQLVNAQRISSEITHQITVRYQSLFADLRDLKNYRALHGGRIFKIHGGINEDEENVLITLYASEGIDDG